MLVQTIKSLDNLGNLLVELNKSQVELKKSQEEVIK